MRRIVGLDLNGWRDFAARDWSPEDLEAKDDALRIIDGGIEGVAVRDLDDRWLGGPQAVLAPHGRGPGWGRIGAPARRRPLAASLQAVLAGETGEAAATVLAASRALAVGAREIVLAVADRPEMDERARAALLGATTLRGRRRRLIWRPVATFLSALERGVIPREGVGQVWRILIHTEDGIEAQTLRLRRDQAHHDHVAPEREGYGRLLHPELGLSILRDRVAREVLAANPDFVAARAEPTRLPVALLCGGASAGDVEVLRAHNGHWTQLRAPDLDPRALLAGEELIAPASPVAGEILLTPLAGAWAATLAARLGDGSGRAPILAKPDEAARGALLAGRLIERGLPHYYDRLEPIALAVLRGDEPMFQPLIPKDATVPANREFVSEPLHDFTWPRGKTKIEFYVLKGETEIRHWVAEKSPPPTRDERIELRLRQTPGQSWARLAIGADDWDALRRAPIALDWEALTPLELTPDEVLERLRVPPPVVPERIVEPADLRFWVSSVWHAHAIGERLTAAQRDPVEVLANTLRWSRREDGLRRRPIGTDGALPEGLPDDMRRAFDAAFSAAVDAMRRAGQSKARGGDNHAMAAVTWAYTLCPEDLQEELVRALEARAVDQPKAHPFNRRPFHATMLIQGAGRATVDAERLARLLRSLTQMRRNNNTVAALALILTRRHEAPAALDARLVSTCLNMLASALDDAVRSHRYKLIFSNTLSAIAGLFRWREREPHALLADRDPVAAQMLENLQRARDAIERQQGRTFRSASLLGRLDAVIALFEGGGSANVLFMLEPDDEDDDGGDAD